MLIKRGELQSFTAADVAVSELVLADAVIANRMAESSEMLIAFRKCAAELKQIAPKAKDFLYFTAVMMHAGEAALLDEKGLRKKGKDGKDITGSFHLKGEGVRWVSSDPTLLPFKNCFIPGTQILMEDGTTKSIEEIEVGDKVITHLGRARTVLNTFITPHNDEVIEIHVRNGRSVTCTDNHPFYRLDVKTSTGRVDSIKHMLREKTSAKEFNFTAASNLNKGDCLLTPVLSEQSGCELSVDQAKLLGLFAAEGCYGKKYNKYQSARFTLNINEINTVAQTIKILTEKVFPNSSVRINPREIGNICEVTVTGTGVVDFFRNHVGEYSTHKTLSRDLVFGPKEIKEAFLVGWLEGDGHVAKDFGQIIAPTVSRNMASQINCMLNSCRIQHSIRITPGVDKIINPKYGPIHANDAYRVEISASAGNDLIKNSEKLNFTNRGRQFNLGGFYEDYALHTITGIDNYDYKGNVYNFEVEEDNSYVAEDLIVHNCNGDIFPEAELKKAHKMWIGKPLCLDHKSNEVEKVRGLIVDTFYDEPNMRVVALCALDKINYPDLARQVETMTTNCVSMGTGVGRAVCTTCCNVARTEHDFCDHMRSRSCYGEINLDLNPIELSIVVNGADPKAKIKHIIAAADSMARYIDAKELEMTGQYNPVEVLASVKNMMVEATELRRGAEEVLQSENKEIKDSLERITNKMAEIVQRLDEKGNEGLNMTTKTAYWQGTEEPKPGTVQYEKADSDSIRANLDKQMVVEPSGGMGPVDKLFPGDEQKKRELQRLADDQARKMTRQAALDRAKKALEKSSYWQGTEEPTPGKTRYPNKDDADKVRNTEDKQQLGAPPFPGVGKVDGLHGDDEAEKKLLQRASVKARFTKAAKPSESCWQIFANDQLVLTATVGEITRGNVDGMYDAVATKQFGTDMINKFKSLGYNKAVEIFKGAQMPPAAPAASPLPSMTEVPAMPVGADAAEDKGKNGDPKEEVKDLVDELGRVSTNLTKAFDAMSNEPSNELDALKPEKMDETMATMARMRKEFKTATLDTLKEMMVEVKEQLSELDTTAELMADESVKKMASPERRKVIAEVVAESLGESRRVIADSYSVLGSVAKYAKGTKQFLKRAQLDMLSNPAKEAPGAHVIPVGNLLTNEERGKALEESTVGLTALQKQTPAESNSGTQSTTKDQMLHSVKDVAKDDDGKMTLDSLLTPAEKKKALEAGSLNPGNATPPSPAKDKMLQDVTKSPVQDSAKADDGKDKDDKNDATVMKQDGTKIELNKDEAKEALKSAQFDLNTREGRTAYRAKLAEKASTFKYNPMTGEAHPGGGFTTKLDNKPTLVDGAKVETTEEKQKRMLEVAQAPVKLRALAAKIDQYVKSGKIKAEDVDTLVSQGLDKDAAAYWKKFYGQAPDGGKEFAQQLVSEHAAKKASEEKGAERVKVARAFELAYQMPQRGMCGNTPEAIAKQAKEFMEFSDAQFESVKRLVSNTPIQKNASFPNVGQVHEGQVVVGPPAAANQYEELRGLFSQTGRRGF